jgi:hypothetical protein
MARRTWWQLLIVVPFVGLIYVPLYASHNFYVFELGCVLLAAAVSWFVYGPEPKRPVGPEAGEEPRFSRNPSIRRYPSARNPRSKSFRA